MKTIGAALVTLSILIGLVDPSSAFGRSLVGISPSKACVHSTSGAFAVP